MLELIGSRGGGIDVNAIPWAEWVFYSNADLSTSNQYAPLTSVNAYPDIDSRTPDGEVATFASPGSARTIDFDETGLYAVSTTVIIQAGTTTTTPALGAVGWSTSGTVGNAQLSTDVPYVIRDAPSGALAGIVLPTLTFPVLSPGTHGYSVRVLCDSGGDADSLAFTVYISIVKIA